MTRSPPSTDSSRCDQAPPTDDIHHFFAEGMLLNVGAAVQLEGEPMTWTLQKLGGAD